MLCFRMTTTTVQGVPGPQPTRPGTKYPVRKIPSLQSALRTGSMVFALTASLVKNVDIADGNSYDGVSSMNMADVG